MRALAVLATIAAGTGAYAAEPDGPSEHVTPAEAGSHDVDGAGVEQPAEPEPETESETAPANDTGEPADETVEHARQAFKLGTTLARQGQWHEALAAFERAARLRPHPATTFNIGYCERALGHYTRARKLLLRALEEHEKSNGGTLPQSSIDQARGYLAEIERRIARAVVKLAAAGSRLSVDGRPLEVVSQSPLTLAAGTLPSGPPGAPPESRFVLLVDPGDHVFVLARDDEPDELETHHFEPGGTLTLELGELPVPAPAHDAPSPQQPSDPPNRLPAYVTWSLAGAALAVGTGTGVASLRLSDDLDRVCPERKTCPSSETDRIQRLDRLTMTSNVSLGIGVAAAITGVVLFLTAKDRPAHADAARGSESSVRPWIGSRGAGLEGRF